VSLGYRALVQTTKKKNLCALFIPMNEIIIIIYLSFQRSIRVDMELVWTCHYIIIDRVQKSL